MTFPLISATPRVSALVAETVGLLLEPLGADETLTGDQAVALAQHVASLSSVTKDTVAALAGDIASSIEAAVAHTGARGAIVRLAHERSVRLAANDVDAAMAIVFAGADPGLLRAFHGAPPTTHDARLYQLDRALSHLRPAAAAVAAAWQAVEGDVVPSVTTLRLDVEINALKDDGWLWGLVRTTSDGARDRVSRHLRASARLLDAAAMADILQRVQRFVDARTRLRNVLKKSPDWAPWLVRSGDMGVLHEGRVEALHWALTEVEAGVFGPPELGLLRRKRWRQLLSHPDAQTIRVGLEAPLEPPAAHEPFARGAVFRLRGWLNPPPDVPPQVISEWASVVLPLVNCFAHAILVAQAGDSEPDLRAAVAAAVAARQSPFGPADPGRKRYRQVHEQVAVMLADTRSNLDGLAPRHPKVAQLISELRATDAQLMRALQPAPPPRGPLRVAIAGRTKAGKTTLRKALTRDPSEPGVGRGAHRTTRTAEDFPWNRLTFVDTPGVAAYDDDCDAELAFASCRDADAVLWLYAESLRIEEARLLQALLQLGKPVLAVYNAKWRVDRPERMALFCRSPGLAFRDEAGHVERVRQVAHSVGLRPPLTLAVHAGAARRSVMAGEASDGAAWQASRMPGLEGQLKRVLAEQAQALRAVRLADQVRAPLSRRLLSRMMRRPNTECAWRCCGRDSTRSAMSLTRRLRRRVTARRCSRSPSSPGSMPASTIGRAAHAETRRNHPRRGRSS